MHKFLILLPALWLSLAETVLAQGADTAELYASWRDRILQVQVIDQQSGSKAGIGSGFFSGKPGWVISNYHVIAELVNQPGRYTARFLTEAGEEGELEILALDTVHDLALLRAHGMDSATPFKLASELPPKGSRVWSMGYPFDIGLTIVEGTHNGMLDKSLYEKLHFTGSINPGMSGGPALNLVGEVIGVNVATAGNQVSFLVPVRFVDELIAKSMESSGGETELNKAVAVQLLDNQERITEQLLGSEFPKTRLDRFEVPGALEQYITCWGDSRDEDEVEMDTVYYRCETQDDIFLSDTLYTGIIRYQHDLISTESLSSMRFYHQLESWGHYPQLRLDGDEKTVSNYHCRSDFVDRQGLPLKATWCVRRYLDLDGLYDAYLEITSLAEPRKALQSSLLLAGFSWENLTRLSERFINAINVTEAESD